MHPGTERSNEAFLRAALEGTRLSQVCWVAETGSTNDDLASAALSGAPEQVLVTDLQTAGRGRRNRVWAAPSGSGVLMSVLLRQTVPADGFWAVGAVSLAACQTIAELVTVPCTLKWPNDVLFEVDGEQRKVAGVLAQVVDDAIIVGIGINAIWPQEVPPALAAHGAAISRHLRHGSVVHRAGLAADILLRVIGHLDTDISGLRSEWMAHCSTLGRRVRVEQRTGETVGIATDLAHDGALQIRNELGESWHRVGDVTHLRNADEVSF